MPLYTYKCPVCQRGQDVIKPIAMLDHPEACGNCGFFMNRQISAPMVRGDYEGYKCPITGDWIEGKKAHLENLKKHGCRVLEPGETDEARKSIADSDLALDRAVEATAEEFVEKLPIRKREQLAAELEAGFDTTVVRQSVN